MKILYVTTISGTINAFLVPHILMLMDEGHTVDVACRITKPLSQALYERGCRVYDLPFQRTPFSSANIAAYKQMTILLSNNRYDIVHCHTPVASALTRLVCRKFRKAGTKVIYTAHGFHFYKGAPLKYWMTYYLIERICARLTDVLITINQEDYALAKRRMKAGEVEFVPGVGINLSKFRDVAIDRTEKRRELGIHADEIVLFSVGELIRRKNHEVVVRAIAKLQTPNIHYMIAGEGELYGHLVNVANALGVGAQIHLLGYRDDIAALCRAADIFIFPSFQEGLPVALMEAMASGLPVICSDIRGNTDMIEDQKGGCLFSPFNADELADIIRKMTTGKIPQTRDYNQQLLLQFETTHVLREMDRIYSKIS